MIERVRCHAGVAALLVSVLSIVISVTGLASAAGTALFGASTKPRPYGLLLLGRNAKFPASAIPANTKPRPRGLLLLGKHGQYPASAIPTVANANRVGGKTVSALVPRCPPNTVDLGSYCLASSLYAVPSADVGMNNYFWATQACAQQGGYLPSAAQLIGAAKRVKLASVLTDSPQTATVDQDPSVGLKDLREMSATLVTTAAGSDAAGSEGVSVGATGDPRTGEPNPTPQPANPSPETLQYVTVYDNSQTGGFAGSEPVSSAENFRCAFNKAS